MPGAERPDDRDRRRDDSGATDPHRDAPEPRHGSPAEPAALAARLDAVERALTDEETPVADLADAAELTSRLDAVDEALADIEDRVEELEAATQALRGFVGGVRAVDRDVERRADAALSRVEALERRLDPAEDGDPGLRVERLAAVDDEQDTGAVLGTGEAVTGGDREGCGDDGCGTGGEDRPEAGLESLTSRLRDAL